MICLALLSIYLSDKIITLISYLIFFFDVIGNLMFLLTEFPLTTDLVLSTLINTLLSERKFFIAFTGMAIGYIKSKL